MTDLHYTDEMATRAAHQVSARIAAAREAEFTRRARAQQEGIARMRNATAPNVIRPTEAAKPTASSIALAEQGTIAARTEARRRRREEDAKLAEQARLAAIAAAAAPRDPRTSAEKIAKAPRHAPAI